MRPNFSFFHTVTLCKIIFWQKNSYKFSHCELATLTNLFIILDVEEEEEANEAHDAEADEDEHHVDSDDLLLPWSCCASMWLKQQEEIEKRLNEPEALANTIRHRLMAKNQVRE